MPPSTPLLSRPVLEVLEVLVAAAAANWLRTAELASAGQ
jgi:hypothetical protein